MAEKPVAIIMGSQSDWATMTHAAQTLDALAVGYEVRIVSAHRTPDRLYSFAKGAQAAGVESSIRVATTDFRDLSAREVRTLSGADMLERGLIIANPPYGERMRPDELRELYADLGRFCASFPGFRSAFLVANPEFESAFGGRPRIKKPLSNGPLRGHFYLYEH